MYDKRYYQSLRSHSYGSATKIIGYLTSFLDVSTVIDFGCGMGTWCLAARELGINKIIGIDQNPYNSEYMLISSDQYLQKDLRNTIDLDMSACIVISVEVVEHIEEEYGEIFVENLCRHSDIILFSAAIPHQGGEGHVNEKPCSYWSKIFASKGYCYIDCIRPAFWDDNDVAVWYKNNCILYVKDSVYPSIYPKVSICPPIDIVHPSMVEDKFKKWNVISNLLQRKT